MHSLVNKELIDKAKAFHGHVCPFLVLGLRASEIAMSKLGISKIGLSESIKEDVIAIVEANNCLSDGVQVATGCTLGNNSLIYIDTGKNAVTMFRRGSKRGVRVYIDADRIRQKYFDPRATELFRKVIVERKGSPEEIEELDKIWEETGMKLASIPEEDFVIQEVEIVDELERAPIFDNVRCSRCGELVMASKAVYVNGEPFCASCAGKDISAVIGRGITTSFRTPFRVLGGT